MLQRAEEKFRINQVAIEKDWWVGNQSLAGGLPADAILLGHYIVLYKRNEAMTMLYERIVDSRLLVRRLTVIADDVATPEELAAGKRYEQLDLFGDDEAQSYGSDSTSEKDGEHDIQRALLDVKRKFGRNAVIKAMDMEDGATGQDRNRQIGGHRA